jgi:tetratricopeptide (TPR) repeat protein
VIGFGFCYPYYPVAPAPVYYPSYYPVYGGTTIVHDNFIYQEGVPQPVYAEPPSYYEQPREQYDEAREVPEESGPRIIEIPDDRDRGGAGLAEEQEELYRLMVEGTESFSLGEFEDAARDFLRVMMADPLNVDAALAYAVARFATGDYDSSALAIRRAIRRVPEVVNAPFDIRDRYGSMSEFELHLANLDRFIRSRPRDPDGWLVRGFVEHFTRQREAAAETFEHILDKFEEDADLAELFLNAKSIEEIEELLESQIPEDLQAPQGQAPPPAPQSSYFGGSAEPGGTDAGYELITVGE